MSTELRKSIWASCLQYLFPTPCLVCSAHIEQGYKTLCRTCQQSLFLLDPLDRCGFCFQPKETSTCSFCSDGSLFCDYKAACFDEDLVTQKLLSSWKKESPFLLKSLAGYLYLQFLSLCWPIPDYITYIPRYFTHPIRSQNSVRQLAHAFGSLLQVPVVTLLKKTSPTLCQANKSRQERYTLPFDTFITKHHNLSLTHRSILIIDDTMVSGKTLECAAFAIYQHNPKKVYGLTLTNSEL